MRYRVIQIVMLAVGSGAMAQSCPPDQDFDGHPLFGVFASRLDTTAFGGMSNGADPMSLDFGDVDGDGDLDVISALGDVFGFVSVSLNDGEGQFAPPTVYPVGPDASQAVLADLDADGDLDIAVTIDDDSTVEILFNDGTGAFSQGGIYPVDRQPRSLVAGDLDGDGDIDLATLSSRNDSLSLLFNLGDGTFADEIRLDLIVVSPRLARFPGPFMTLLDLEGDGDLDIAVPSVDRVVLVVNDGNGNFTTSDHQPRSADVIVCALGAADLDGDGDDDLVASITTAPHLMAVWLNEGDGTFSNATNYDAPIIGGGSTSLSIGDFDRDGDQDIALGHPGLGRHFIARNNGDGSFATPEDILTIFQPVLVEWADLNADGWLDLGTVTWGPQPALFLARLNDGTGNLSKARNVEANFPNTEYSAADVGDIDGDGNLDLAVAVSLDNEPFQYRVLQGDGTGGFVERHQNRFPIPTPVSVSVVRFEHLNGDDHVDLVFSVNDDQVMGFTPGSVWIAPGLGDFQFGKPRRYETPDGVPFGMDVVDIDGDGDLDVLARVRQHMDEDDLERALKNWVVVFINNGLGELSVQQRVFLHADRSSRVTGDVIAGDFDGDGDLDAIASSGLIRTPAPLYYLENDGTGSLSVASETIVASWAHSLAVGDWDHDGDLDVAAMHWRDEMDREYLTILDNDGSANFTATQTYTDTDIKMGNKMLAADVNGDGWDDILLVTWKSGVVIHLNDRRGGFADRAWYASNTPTAQVFVADFDHDGDNDVLAPSRNDGGLGPIVMLENIACRCAADLNHDGVLSADDFFLFLDRYSRGNIAFCDVDHDGDCDAEDFFAYLDLFAAGC